MSGDLETKIEDILTRGVAEVIDKEHLKKRLLSGEKLRIKLGIDPTSPNLHLGRAVVLLKLRDLQELGHQIVFIIGDFTGMIGDTSDKDSERIMLSEALVQENMKTYLDQIFTILDEDKTEIHYNSLWLRNINLHWIGHMATWFSLAEFISRENIKKRLKEGKRISLREVLYPLMQGYDSMMVDSDLEIGGTDQKFNMLAGRELQRHSVDVLSPEHSKLIRKIIKGAPKQRSGHGIESNPLREEPQDILMVNLIEGTDGRKMSSSWGNTINILDKPNDMFIRVMRIPDWLIKKYFTHCTRVPETYIEKIDKEMQQGKINPRDVKLELATEIVKIYHGEEISIKARKYFIETVSEKKLPSLIKILKIKKGDEINLVKLVKKAMMSESSSEARRKIEEGAVELDGKRIKDWKMVVGKEYDDKVLRVGKIYIVKIKFAE